MKIDHFLYGLLKYVKYFDKQFHLDDYCGLIQLEIDLLKDHLASPRLRAVISCPPICLIGIILTEGILKVYQLYSQ